jgi:AcrR family transcriptional regulator
MVARDKFFAEGFDNVSMEQVAAEARVSKGTLYARHPSKESLFRAVIHATVEGWSEEAGRNDALLPKDLAGRLRHHARTIARSSLRDDVQATRRLIVSTSQRFPLLSAAMHETGYRFIIDLLVGEIEAAAARDGIPARDPEGVAKLLVNALSDLRIQEGLTPEQDDAADRFADRVVDLLLAARAAW